MKTKTENKQQLSEKERKKIQEVIKDFEENREFYTLDIIRNGKIQEGIKGKIKLDLES